MIRRTDQDHYLLITQSDHAEISAQIAAEWGNGLFPPPKPRDEVLGAIECHDAGWSLHDDKPVLNHRKIPAAFYEMPYQWYVRVWVASIAAAAARGGPMGGLLVSWHFSQFARLAPLETLSEPVRLHLEDFIAAQYHRREDYCKILDLSRSMVDDHPVAKTKRDGDALYNYYLLKVSDWISLHLCDTDLPAWIREPVRPFHDANVPPIKAKWINGDVLRLNPWPFGVSHLSIKINCIRIPGGTYRRDSDLLRVYQNADSQILQLTLGSLEWPEKHSDRSLNGCHYSVKM